LGLRHCVMRPWPSCGSSRSQSFETPCQRIDAIRKPALLCGMVDEIQLTPRDGELAIEVKGNLAGC
jgi:hypothetical protein